MRTYLTTPEACETFKISRHLLHQRVKKGRFVLDEHYIDLADSGKADYRWVKEELERVWGTPREQR